ncbi:MAG TPA: protein kinase [Polyangiaceae bacterium]|nr:protein kinase [Polyangiaceae bacterium]
MIRCPQCGLRLPVSEPICPVHGSAVQPTSAPPPTDSSPPAEPALELRGYDVKGVLGRGGFGVVYRAERTLDGVRVAIKAASREQRGAGERLAAEALALQRIAPPLVPAVYERGESAGRGYIVLELLEAPTLAVRLGQRRGVVPLPEFGREAQAILSAVEGVHARGYLHCDLKPENIFLTDTLGVKLIDFGSARLITDDAKLADGSPALGTAEYMAPEQCEGRGDLGPAVDVYALGVVLYEMLCGATPFWGSAGEVREAQMSRRPPRLSMRAAVPVALEAVVLRCLAKNPEQRFPSVRDLRLELATAIQDETTRGSGGWSVVRSTPHAAAQLGRPKGQAAPSTSAQTAREKRVVGLLFFESTAGVVQVTQALAALGGQLAQANSSRYVGVFGHEVGDNPARVALASAQRMLERQLCQRVLVDVAPVAIQVRSSGDRRFFSTLFARKDRYPLLSDPRGILLTESAAEVLSDVPRQPALDRAGVFRVDLSTDLGDITTFGTHGEALLGRESLIGTLMQDIRSALVPPCPTIVTVLGEPGYGKSLLASTIVQRLPQFTSGVRAIKLAGQDSIGGASHATLRDLLRQLLRVPEGAPADQGEAFLTERIGTELGPQAWAATALVLGWVSADHPQVRQLSAAPGALRSAAARAAGELLRRSARATPVLVVLDDAHLAEEAGLDALEYATLREEALPICICAFARPSLERARPTWGTRAAVSHTLPLPALERQEAELLLRRLLEPVEHVPESALQRLFERTQGIPRLMVELVRGLKRGGLVKRSERGSVFYLATDELEKLPDLPVVQWSAAREVEALSPQLAAHARLASVFGAKFRGSELEGVLRILERDAVFTETQLDVEVGLDRLLDAGLMQRGPFGQIDFRNAFLRETLYETLPENLKQAAHRAAVEMYEDALSLSEEERLPRLALHAARSGLRERAASTYLLLADRAQIRHAYLDAELMYDAALENLRDDDDLAISNAAQGRGLMRFRLGRCEDAVKDFALAASHARRSSNPEKELELLLDEAMVLDWVGDYQPSTQLGQAVAARIDAGSSNLLRARSLMALGRTALRENQLPECLSRSTEAAALAEPLGDTGYETFVISMLLAGASAAMLGHLDEAQKFLDRASYETQSRGDLLHAAGAHNNRANIWIARCDVANVARELEHVRRIGRQTGFAPLEYHAEANLGEIYYTYGDLESARLHIERAIRMGTQLWGESIHVWRAELLEGRLALYRGDEARARAILETIRTREARELAAGRKDAQLSGTDAILADMVDLATRPTGDDEWERLSERCRAAGAQQELVEVLEARALKMFRAGDPRAARCALEEVLEVAVAAPGLLVNRIKQNLSALAR